jgi:hypothetical protein
VLVGTIALATYKLGLYSVVYTHMHIARVCAAKPLSAARVRACKRPLVAVCAHMPFQSRPCWYLHSADCAVIAHGQVVDKNGYQFVDKNGYIRGRIGLPLHGFVSPSVMIRKRLF